MSTPQFPGSHETRPPSDPWWPRSDESTDVSTSRAVRDPVDPGDDIRDDRDSPYYRGLRDLRDAPYDDPRFDRDALYEEPSRGRTVRHLLSAFLCLVLTPIGIASMAYGADRYRQLTLDQVGADRDPGGLVALGAGAGVILIVASLGALSAIGPVLAGVTWGLVPAGLYLAYPRDTVSEVANLPVLADFARSGTVAWLGYGVFWMVGFLLVGAGIAAAMRRPAET